MDAVTTDYGDLYATAAQVIVTCLLAFTVERATNRQRRELHPALAVVVATLVSTSILGVLSALRAMSQGSPGTFIPVVTAGSVAALLLVLVPLILAVSAEQTRAKPAVILGGMLVTILVMSFIGLVSFG